MVKALPYWQSLKNKKSAVEKALNEQSPGEFSVALGMRYGNPSIASALKILESENCEKILVLPLYPQYASSSTGSALDAVSDEIKNGEKYQSWVLLIVITRKIHIFNHWLIV